MWLTGPAAPWHVGSSQTRARTRVPCISRQILNHCATREAPRPGDSDAGGWLEDDTLRNIPLTRKRANISLMNIYYLPNTDRCFIHTVIILQNNLMNKYYYPILQIISRGQDCGLISGLKTNKWRIKDSSPCSSSYFFPYTKLLSFAHMSINSEDQNIILLWVQKCSVLLFSS